MAPNTTIAATLIPVKALSHPGGYNSWKNLMKTNLQTLGCWEIANGKEPEPYNPGLRSGPHTWDDLLRVEELKTKYEEEKDEIKQDKILELMKNRVKDYVDWDTRNKAGTSFVTSKLSETTRDSIGNKDSLKDLWDTIETTMGQTMVSHFVHEMDTTDYRYK
jgi:hypothetical protein